MWEPQVAKGFPSPIHSDIYPTIPTKDLPYFKFLLLLSMRRRKIKSNVGKAYIGHLWHSIPKVTCIIQSCILSVCTIFPRLFHALLAFIDKLLIFSLTCCHYSTVILKYSVIAVWKIHNFIRYCKCKLN